MALEPQKPPVQFSYEDRPELSETFADSVYSLMFDGQTLRIIFTVTRVEPSPTGKPTGGKCFPTRRLVLSGAGMAQLLNHVAQLNEQMSRRRALRMRPSRGSEARSNQTVVLKPYSLARFRFLCVGGSGSRYLKMSLGRVQTRLTSLGQPRSGRANRLAPRLR